MATFLFIAGTTIAAAGAIQSGRQAAGTARNQKKISDYNSLLMEREAKAIEQKAKFDQLQHAKFSREKMGQLRVAQATSGTTGSGLLEEEQAAELELENMQIGYEGRVGAGKARSQAGIDRLSGDIALQRGRNARTASAFQAGSTLLTGFGQAYSPSNMDDYLARKHGIRK